MRIKDRVIKGANIEVIVIPRGNGDDIVLKAQAVIDMGQSDKLNPMPTPPKKMLKGNVKVDDVADPAYKAQVTEYGRRRTSWLILKSLEATEGLTWDSVNMDDPDSWNNYEQELSDAGFSEIEKVKIVNGVFAANCLDEGRLEEARQRFLHSQELDSTSSSSLMAGQSNTQSGVLVKDGE